MLRGQKATYRPPYEHGSYDASEYDERYDFSVHCDVSVSRLCGLMFEGNADKENCQHSVNCNGRQQKFSG